MKLKRSGNINKQISRQSTFSAPSKMRETSADTFSLSSTNKGAKKRKRGSGGYQVKVTAVKMENGANVLTSPEALGKRDSITLSTVPASERHTKFGFTDSFSRLISEIYQVCESMSNLLSGPYTLEIPIAQLSLAHYHFHVMHRTSAVKSASKERQQPAAPAESSGSQPSSNNTAIQPLPLAPILSSDGWVIVTENVLFNADGKQVTINSNSPGWWMVVSTIKEEFFTLPAQGVLFSSKLSRFVSGRFPKGAILPREKERKYRHRIIPLASDLLPRFQIDMLQLKDLVVLSDVFEFEEMPSPGNNNGTTQSTDFNRPATIRLPLPDLPERLPDKDCVWRIFYRTGALKGTGWTMFESPSKQITRTSLAFDTRRLGAYIVAYTLSNLNPYLGSAITFIWQQSFIMQNWECAACGRANGGAFWLAFTLVHDQKDREEWFAKKAPKGYKPLRTAVVVKEEEDSNGNNKVALPGGRRAAPLSRRYFVKETAESYSIDPLSISAGQFIRLTIEGEIRWAENGKRPEYLLQVQPYLTNQEVEFRVEPELLCDNPRAMFGTLKAALVSNDESCEYRELAAFSVDLTRDQVKEWWEILHPPPPPVETPPRPKEGDAFERLIANNPISLDAPSTKVSRPVTVGAAPRQISAAFVRLTTQPATRRRTDFTKESRILSGRSLHCLASELRDGLVLALNLGLPDSMVTGIGFDALSEGLSLIEVTYRILLLWKRRTNRSKNQVSQLVEAVTALGREDMAEMIEDHALQNVELTPACIAEYRGGGGANNGDEKKNVDFADDSPRGFKTTLPVVPNQGNNNPAAQNRHVVSGTCQAKKLAAEAKANQPPVVQSQEITHPQIEITISAPEPAYFPPPAAVEYRVSMNAPRLIGVENGPVTTLQSNTNNPYLSKLAPIMASEQSAEFVAKNKPSLVKKSKNNIENAINQEEAPDRPGSPASSDVIADDVSQISL